MNATELGVAPALTPTRRADGQPVRERIVEGSRESRAAKPPDENRLQMGEHAVVTLVRGSADQLQQILQEVSNNPALPRPVSGQTVDVYG